MAGAGSLDIGKVYQICSLHVKSNIRNRYAHTVVRSEILNTADFSKDVTFRLTIPETAFISSFCIEVDGKQYDALVKEKEEARQEYDQGRHGRTAAHVAVNPRESNHFSVSVNVEAQKKIKFMLTYEELLNRRLGTYKHFINLEPEQIVEDFHVQINIEETTNITTLTVPAFKEIEDSDFLSSSESEDINKLAIVRRPTPHSAIIRFAPTPDQQRELSINGIRGQLVVLYDVDRSSSPSQVLVNNGYFAHFFAPDGLNPLPKFVIFVLDISGSMYGHKMKQLKDAMESILSELHEQDHFTLLTFEDTVQIWRLIGEGEFSTTTLQETDWENFVISISLDNIIRAKLAVHKLEACGGTDVFTAFMAATHVAKLRYAVQQAKSIHLEPLIIFLTDGQPTVGETDVNEIIYETTRLNQLGQAAIFSLGLGTDVDFDFLKKLSLRNSGFARKIYEASDTAIQLANFYKEVSSPLLSNINFIYQPEQVDITSLTRDIFITFFHGSEITVCGRVDEKVSDQDFFFNITGNSVEGTKQFTSEDTRVEVLRNPGFMERLWGYLTIQQLLEEESKLEGEDADKKKQQAAELALKFSFVTPVTSLVVVQPEDEERHIIGDTYVDPNEYDMLDSYSDNSSMDMSSTCQSSMRIYKYTPQSHVISMYMCPPESQEDIHIEQLPVFDKIFLCDFFVQLEEENISRCKICKREIIGNYGGKLRSHILNSHPEEAKLSLLDFDFCHIDDCVVIQDLIEALNNENISQALELRIKEEASDAEYKIYENAVNCKLFLKVNVAMKKRHFFLIISIQSFQNEDSTVLAIVEIERDSTSETLTGTVMETLKKFQIPKSCILLFITECTYDTRNFTTEDQDQIDKLAGKIIEGVQSNGITGGWNPKKVMKESVCDALKSIQPIVMKLEKAAEEMEMPTTADMTEENIRMDYHFTYNILSNFLDSKETSTLDITEEEWDEIAEIVDVLKPLKIVMEELTQKQNTIGDLYGTWLAYAKEIKKIGSTFAETLITCIYKKAIEQCPLFLSTLFLDPRQKSHLDDSQVSLAKDEIMKIWQITNSTRNVSRLVGNKEMQELLKNYVNSVEKGIQHSTLEYWESQKEIQPIMYKLASTILSFPLSEPPIDEFLSNVNILLSSFPDDMKRDIVTIRCFKMFGTE